MVCASVPRLDFVPVVNLSRVFLFRAADALNDGRIFEAGVLLREAVRRQLYAECCWKGCLPPEENKRRSPLALLFALKRAGHTSKIGFLWTKDIIDVGNKCAHCIPVRPNLVRDCILIWHESIDHDPCGEPTERAVQNFQPHEKHPLLSDPDDIDDNDSADWWKRGEEGGQQS